MAIDEAALDAIARAYVAPMSSIRGRRVHRLLMRRFAGYEHVLEAADEQGAPALLAVGDGRLAVCRTDGRGPAAEIVELVTGAGAAAVTTAYDLSKDSLPIASWTVRHPGIGVLTVPAGALAREDRERVADALRGPG